MKPFRENAAGIDIGAKQVFVSVEGEEVKTFNTFTEDFQSLSSYLKVHQIKTVAMEATGVYWFILYEILEADGFDVWLVDGRETMQVPGRKTDVKDCQWIQQLHRSGMLKRCFVAPEHIKELRTIQRLREDHIRSSASYINQMQKYLTTMNIRLKEVFSQIHGVSGMRIIDAILKGEREANVLLSLCEESIVRKKKEQVLKALNGRYTNAGLFSLRQAYDSYMFYQKQIAACDKELERIIQKMGNEQKDAKLQEKRKPIRHNKPKVKNLGANLIEIFQGRDATKISGITDYSWLRLLSEIGSDLTPWPSEKHFTSWLGLSPGQHDSGKKKRNKRKKGRPKAGQIFRVIAQSLIESKNIALGAFGRRIRAKKGPAIAIKATARKIAQLYWRVMVKGVEYAEFGVKHYEQQLLLRKQKSLERLALELNIELVHKQQHEFCCH